jgi:RNA polymerase sigma factor (sigma-70 family)
MGSPNQTAWVMQVVDTFEGRLVRYAADLVGPAMARDVVQDTFLRLCDQDRARVEAHLAAWLFTVCRNRALEMRRKLKRQGPLDTEHEPEPTPQAADVAYLHQEALVRMRKALAALPERERELVRLKFDSELSYKEIAAVTGLSVTNVGFILHTAVRRMRTQVEGDDAAHDAAEAPRELRTGRTS